MIFPIETLNGELREIGMVVGVLIGFSFGFVLERAGFGRAPRLAAQFYFYDMTVFKVMFGAIVTAMLGLVVASGLGLVDLVALSEGAASQTFIWPMLVGGLLLGAGFIVSGYCPGTSLVASASGNLDGVVAVIGAGLGTLLFAEVFPLVKDFYLTGAKGHLFLYQWLGIPPVAVALLVTALALVGFRGAEKVEKFMTQRFTVAQTVVDEEVRQAVRPRRLAFGVYALVLGVALVTFFLPISGTATATTSHAQSVSVEALARQVLDAPWTLRILDLRATEACAKSRIPGAECTPQATLEQLGLGYASGTKTLVLVGEQDLKTVPQAAANYPGEILLLEGGFAAWQSWALEAPAPLTPAASKAERDAWQLRAAINGALTGRAAPPPPPPPTGGAVPMKKGKGGGCSG